METLFRPSHRWEALELENPDRREIHLPQVELFPHLTPPDARATGNTWEAFCCFLRGKVIWMTSDVYVSSQNIFFLPVDPVVLQPRGDGTAGSVCLSM
jgi:hypothetical protein